MTLTEVFSCICSLSFPPKTFAFDFKLSSWGHRRAEGSGQHKHLRLLKPDRDSSRCGGRWSLAALLLLLLLRVWFCFVFFPLHLSLASEPLTDDFPAGVLRRDGDSAGGTLAGFLQPRIHAGRAEHVVVGADDRLPDLHGEKRPGVFC